MRAVLTALAVLAGLWLVLVLAAWGLQRQLIYLPTSHEPVPPDEVEEVTLATDDGLELTAWYVTPRAEPVATVLVLPGNAGDRSLRLPLADGLVARGHAVLLVDYRGYGGNPGSPDEAGLRRDAVAARDHLRERDDVDAGRIVYLGESLGSGVAATLAAAHPPAALVLRSPFTALADVGRAHYPFLPVRTLLWDRFETREHLADHAGPVLVVAGGQDAVVPTELSVEVAHAVGADYRELEGVDHNDRELLDGDDYLDAVDEFVRAQLGQS